MAKSKRKAAKKIKTLVANQLILKGLNGKVKAFFDASDESDYVSFDLYGYKKQTAVGLSIGPEGNPVIHLSEKGKTRIVLGVGAYGAGISIADTEGRPICRIDVAEDGIPRIRLSKVTSPKSAKSFWSTPEPKINTIKKR